MQQELQHQFELLNNIILRQMGLHCSVLPTGIAEVTEADTKTLKGQQPQETSGNNRTHSPVLHISSSVHQEQGALGTTVEASQSTMSLPLGPECLSSESSASYPAEKTCDWLPCCESSRAPQKGFEDSNSLSLSVADEQVESGKGAPGGGTNGIQGDSTSSLSSFDCQRQHGDGALERSQVHKAIPCINSVILNSSEDESSMTHNMQRSFTESQSYLQQPEGKVRQTGCLPLFCPVTREGRPAQNPQVPPLHGQEKKIAVARITRPGSNHRTRTNATPEYQHNPSYPTFPCSTDDVTAYPTDSQGALEHKRADEWRPATTAEPPPLLYPCSASSQTSQKILGCSQLALPALVVTAERQPVPQQVQQQWKWQRMQQAPVPAAAAKQRRSYGYFPYAGPMFAQTVTVPWVTLVTPKPHLWSYWKCTNRADELFVGERGAPLPSTKHSVPIVRTLPSAYFQYPCTTELCLLG